MTVGFNALKAERIVNVGLQLLERELTLPSLVWRDAAGDFAGAKNDTISIRVPAYAKAKTRALRSGDPRDRDRLQERKVDVTLDTDVYKDVRISDEELTLDIANFGEQVLAPIMSAHARALEDELATLITGANYETSVALPQSDPYLGLVDARKALNDARVPAGNRFVVVGSSVESAILKSDRLTKFDNIGSYAETAIREATIGRMAGFEIVTSPVLDPESAFAFHRSAFVMSSRAPQVPQGAPYGASGSTSGFAIRVVRVLDPDTIEDVLATDSWVGVNVVTDHGTMTDGIFEPVEGDESNSDSPSGADDLFVRAVELTLDSSA